VRSTLAVLENIEKTFTAMPRREAQSKFATESQRHREE